MRYTRNINNKLILEGFKINKEESNVQMDVWVKGNVTIKVMHDKRKVVNNKKWKAMANSCNNTLELEGPEEVVSKVYCAFEKMKDIQTLRNGEGVNYRDVIGDDSSYENYLFDIYVGGECCIDFQTKWSEPKEDIRLMSLKFPNVSFMLSYEELGNAIFGKVIIKNGEIIMDVDLSDEINSMHYQEDSNTYLYRGLSISDNEYLEFLNKMLNDKINKHNGKK